MKLSEELQQRKTELLSRTWVQGMPAAPNESCLVYDYSAFYETYIRKLGVGAGKFLEVQLGLPTFTYDNTLLPWWNDEEGRTAGDVFAALDEAILAAKEMESQA